MKKSLLPAALAAVALSGCASDPAAGPASSTVPATLAVRPNILLIVSEDHGPELGCYGDPFVRTPVLDRLAADGMRFDRAYVTQAGCSPSRASIHTGLYPSQNGQIALATWGFRMYSANTPNIPRSLKAAGYRTGIIGKLHINPAEAFPFDFAEISRGNFARRDLPDYARFAGRFMRRGEEPFFLVVNYPDAHSPWQRQVDGLPPEPLNPEDIEPLPYFGVDTPQLRETLANHYNSIMRLDTLVGDLLAQLEASGKAENTIVLFVSDHGPDLIRGKRTVYEGGVHVPFIVRWPGQVDPGSVSRELVSMVDLFPTFLDLSGAAPVAGLPGKSLLPIFAGGPEVWREYLYTEFHAHGGGKNLNPQRAIRDDRFKLIHNLIPGVVNPAFVDNMEEFDSVPAAAAAAAPHVRATYERIRIPPPFELYDLQEDPNEFFNLAEDPAHAAVFARLQAALLEKRRAIKDPLLDPVILEQFRNEVGPMTNRQRARDQEWRYPEYFFPQRSNR
ncbi:MAG: sulfatase [Opitutales bacterium]|nr:sulfatase [Opitutales bacterium]